MANRERTSIAQGCCLSILGAFVLLGALGSAGPAQESGGYAPVAPAPAIHLALQSQLNVVKDWLKDKDYASALEASQGLTVLAHLYGYQDTDAAWQKRIAGLRDVCGQLTDAAKRKAPADADKAVEDCSRMLDDLAKNPPSGTKMVVKNFKPAGSTKVWMQLMESVRLDAKSAKQAQDLERFAQAIAEEANAVAYLRGESRWRSSAFDVRESALKMASLAKENKLDDAKQMLKTVYQRCEVCHERYQK